MYHRGHSKSAKVWHRATQDPFTSLSSCLFSLAIANTSHLSPYFLHLNVLSPFLTFSLTLPAPLTKSMGMGLRTQSHKIAHVIRSSSRSTVTLIGLIYYTVAFVHHKVKYLGTRISVAYMNMTLSSKLHPIYKS